MTVDAFATGALGIDDVVERPGAIEQGTHQAAFLPVGVFDAAFAFGELGMLAGLARACGEEQRATKALGAKAVGVPKLVGGIHAQPCPAAWSSIGVARHLFVPMVIEWDGGDPLPMGHRLIDVPIVEGGIGRDMGGQLAGGDDGCAGRADDSR